MALPSRPSHQHSEEALLFLLLDHTPSNPTAFPTGFCPMKAAVTGLTLDHTHLNGKTSHEETASSVF